MQVRNVCIVTRARGSQRLLHMSMVSMGWPSASNRLGCSVANWTKVVIKRAACTQGFPTWRGDFERR